MSKVYTPKSLNLYERIVSKTGPAIYQDPRNSAIRRANQASQDQDLEEERVNLLFSPLDQWRLTEVNNFVVGNPNDLAIRNLIVNFVAFIDRVLKLANCTPNDKLTSLEIDEDNKVEVSNLGNGKQEYHIITSQDEGCYENLLDIKVSTAIEQGKKYLTSLDLVFRGKYDELPQAFKLIQSPNDKIEISSWEDAFVEDSPAVQEDKAFFFEKARRLLDLRVDIELGKFVPPLFFINPGILSDKEWLNLKLNQLKQASSDYFTQAPEDLIVRSAHIMEGTKDLPLSGIFASIPGIGLDTESVLKAIDDIKANNFNLNRLNLSLRDFQHLSMDDLGAICMPNIQAKYFVKIEPVIYSDSIDLERDKPISKLDSANHKVDFEVKVYEASGQGPGKLLKRTTINEFINNLEGLNISPEQATLIADVYQKVSQKYSNEFQEVEFVIGEEINSPKSKGIHLVQTRDQAANKKLATADDLLVQRKYEFSPRDSSDEKKITEIESMFPDEDLPMIVINEEVFLSQEIPKYLKGRVWNELASGEYEGYKKQILEQYHQQLQETIGGLPAYQIYVKDLSISNRDNSEEYNPEHPIRELGLVNAYQDLIEAAELTWVEQCHVLRSGSEFHNLLLKPKAKQLTVTLPKEGYDLKWSFPEMNNYDHATHLCKSRINPKDLIRKVMKGMQSFSHCLSLDISQRLSR